MKSAIRNPNLSPKVRKGLTRSKILTLEEDQEQRQLIANKYLKVQIEKAKFNKKKEMLMKKISHSDVSDGIRFNALKKVEQSNEKAFAHQLYEQLKSKGLG